MSLDNYSDDDLRDELRRRFEARLPQPKIRAAIDLTRLIERCQEHVIQLALGKDTAQDRLDVYHLTMTTLYGENAIGRARGATTPPSLNNMTWKTLNEIFEEGAFL